jgi:hypothetical protein
MAIKTIIAIMAITKKIPKPIPALKMPAIVSQELRVTRNENNKMIVDVNFKFFMKAFLVA